ncbi:MAG: SRPBCC family protein [Anaerolineae bacterium]
MNSFKRETIINASADQVWQALADIGEIHQWNPGVVSSKTTSTGVVGLGATRYCDLGGKNYLDEKVVAWQPNEQITMRITATNMPFAQADIRFYLRPEGNGTHVTVSPEYKLKYGVVGTILDKLFVEKTYSKGMESLLAGLKEHVESQITPLI